MVRHPADSATPSQLQAQSGSSADLAAHPWTPTRHHGKPTAGESFGLSHDKTELLVKKTKRLISQISVTFNAKFVHY